MQWEGADACVLTSEGETLKTVEHIGKAWDMS